MLTTVIVLCLFLHVSSTAYEDFEFDDFNFGYDETLYDDETAEVSCNKPLVNLSQPYERQPHPGIIHLPGGAIKGEETELGFYYRGIPYAEPPIGELRFANPREYKGKWTGVRDCSKFGPKCAQYDHNGYKFAGSEDCLTLNVFVPKDVMTDHILAPVVVFIHGGGFMFGGAEEYNQENFMQDHRMILVTMNYRLGILGFLSTEDSVIPGNFGLKDQVQALQWVKTTIAAFVGDPRSITISGFSAGAASVHLHYMSPLTKGLFSQGISHSGNALDPWVMQEKASKKAVEVGIRFNCRRTEDPNWLLLCLRGIPVEELVMFSSHFQRFMYNPFAPFGVVVEPESQTAYLTDNPRTLLRKGKFLNLPWILSQTKDEGLYPAAEFVDRRIMPEVEVKWADMAPYLLDYVSVMSDFNHQMGWTNKIRKEYFKDHPINMESFFTFRKVINRSFPNQQTQINHFVNL
jgi:carboxylesterase type B